MTLRNTTVSYGTLAKFLHWAVASLFLAAYCAVYYRHWFTAPCPRSMELSDCAPESFITLNLHKSFGLTIAVFVVLRIIWRLLNPVPKPEPGSRLEHLGAKLGHGALYFFMIAMPITGYVSNGGGANFFWLIKIPAFWTTGLYDLLVTRGMGGGFETFSAALEYFHHTSGAWLVWVLIVIHVAAALYHHYWKKDQTLVRILPERLAKRFSRRGPDY